MTSVLTAEEIDRIDREVDDHYPYPLVATYKRAFFQAPDPVEAHECLLDLFEVTLKYLASIAIAQYLRDGTRDATINRDLQDLQRPSLGRWEAWLRDILRVYQRDERPLLTQMQSFFRKRHAGEINLAAQGFSKVLTTLGSAAPAVTGGTISTQQFFDLLVGYRNRLAHGTRGSTHDREVIAELLAPAMRQLYREMAFIADFQLDYVRSVSVEFGAMATDSHRYRHLLTHLTGDTPRALPTPRVSDSPYPERQLYVLQPAAGFNPLLSLHPLFIFTHCASCNREQAFVLNSSSSSGQDYLSYQCTHHVRTTESTGYLQRLLQQLQGAAPVWDDEQNTTRWQLLHKTVAAEAPAPPVPEQPSPPPLPPSAPPATGPVPAVRVTGAGREMVISDARQLVVGRDASADLRYEDARVSRRHAAIRWDGACWRIEDLQSRNGTFLDAERITERPVDGATTFHLGGADGPTLELAPGAPPAAAPNGLAPAAPAPPPLDPPPGAGPPMNASTPAPPAVAVPTRPATAPADLDLGAIAAAHRIRSERVAIGRAADNDIVLADQSVSRHHAEICWSSASGYSITDLGSHNGTFVNGHRVSTAPLAELDVVTVGRHRLRLVAGTLEDYVTEDVRIEVEGITVRTEDNRVLLDNVTFVLDKKSFLAVVGPSGAGKTTLVNAMTGFRPADSGSVRYGGRDLYAEYDDLRRSIGYVPQDDIIHTQLTVRQALSFTAELRFPDDVPAVERERRVDEVTRELGLHERADLAITRLSGGQRKRANIGVELLTKPSPLFLDEPTSGLDPGMEKGVMTLLRTLADGGRTVIIVTHSQQSLQLCDRVLFLAPGGKLAFFGPPGDALRYFQRDDFADVFTDLEQHPEVGWDQRFRASEEYRTYIESQLTPRDGTQAAAQIRPVPARPAGAWRKQTWTLLRRYVATIASDRRNLALLLLQAPLLALLMITSLGSNAFTHPNALAQTVVTVAVLTVTLTGLLNSIREIVKEFPIYQRERFVGLSIRAYVLSKLGVLAPLTIVQAVILVLVGMARQPVHGSAAALGSPTLELVIDVAFAGLAAMSVGLMVSAAMRSADKAISVLVLLVVAQLIMSLPVLQIGDKPVLGQLSWLSSAKWGVDAVGSTVNLNLWQPPLGGIDKAWNHTAGTWLSDVGMLVLISVAAVAATLWLLRRRDPSLLVAPRRSPTTSRPSPPGP